jgi:hypothetical protein
MSLPEDTRPEDTSDDRIEKIYLEASQWVRLANTVIWSMGTLLVPISFGFVGLALNKSPSTQFDFPGKVLLCIGSVFLFAFWVYASFLYTRTSRTARNVLAAIEKEKWQIPPSTSFYVKQNEVISRWYRLPNSQLVALTVLIVVWLIILIYPL